MVDRYLPPPAAAAPSGRATSGRRVVGERATSLAVRREARRRGDGVGGGGIDHSLAAASRSWSTGDRLCVSGDRGTDY